jgi:GNAT superfamily N-acetyltransferase
VSLPDEPCRFLEWDTSFFGWRIAKLLHSRLTEALISLVHEWCQERSIDCLYFLADSDDPRTIWLAEEHRFQLVEVRYTLERSLKDWDPDNRPLLDGGLTIRPPKAADIPTLQDIARTCYLDSRFYFDPHFSEDNWGAYYATWVKKSCEGGADLALVAEKDGQVVGYITGLIDPQNNQGIYELTGVKETERRTGVGQELFRSGLDWYVRHSVDTLWVATQGRNIVTQRMIQRHGFLSKSCQLYYHIWFRD